MSYLSLFYFLLALAGFGSTFAVVNIAVDYFSPMHVATARAVIAMIATLIFIAVVRVKVPLSIRSLVAYTAFGVLTLGFPFALIGWSQSLIDSSLGGVIFASMPLMILLLSAVILPNSIPTVLQLFGAVIGMTGVFIATTGGSITPDSDTIIGALLTLLSVVFYSLGAVYVKRFDDIDPRALIAGQLISASIALLLLTIWDLPSIDLPANASPYIALIILGVFCTSMPMISLFLLIQRAGPASASLIAFFIPLVAIMLGALMLNEALPVTLIIGGGLVIIGAWFVLQPAEAKQSKA